MINQAFIDDLTQVINKHSVDNDVLTPDFILAAYLANCAVAYGNALKERKRWFAEDAVVTPLGEPARAQDPEYLDVKLFHRKFAQIFNERPVFLSTRLAGNRQKFMQEELNEFWEGVEAHDLAKIADSLIDLVYVAKGTAVMYGLPWRRLWDDVQRANMAKVPGATHRGFSHDVCKPEGWVGPRTEAILAEAGYNETEVWRDVDYLDESQGAAAYFGARRGFPENPFGGSER